VSAQRTPNGDLQALLDDRRDEILSLAARHHGSRVRLFGSVARGEDSAASDIDLLVDFSEGSSLFDLIRLARELEALLGRSVDVVSVGGLKPRDAHILAEARDL
jgi:predicted nucleotidyltransferase